MSATEAARERYVEGFAELEAERAGEPTWLRSLRREGLARFAERGFPSGRDEEWRYTNVLPLAKIDFQRPGSGRDVARDAVEAIAAPLFACSAFVFVDGRFAPELSAGNLAGAVHVQSLSALAASRPELLEGHLGRCVETKRHPFAALNTAYFEDGAAVLVPRDARLEQPLHLIFVATGVGPPALQSPRVLIALEPGSRACVIQDHVSLSETPGFTNAVTELRVGANAALDFVLLQRESDATCHVGNLSANLARDARLSAHTLTLGGALVRNDAEVLLSDEGADCTLNGLFLGDGPRVVDNHTLVDHAMPHGTSRELYKGVLGDRSRGVFRGRVVVRPDAQKTSAEQSNPNLLLSDDAEVDTKPQLEIYADDVKCNHGSSTGQLDPDALFYLRARGLDALHARDLLTQAFAREILDALPVTALADQLQEELMSHVHHRREGLA